MVLRRNDTDGVNRSASVHGRSSGNRVAPRFSPRPASDVDDHLLVDVGVADDVAKLFEVDLPVFILK